MTKIFLTLTSVLALNAGAALAADCSSVSLSDVGWTDITSTTSTAKQVLTALGYKVDVKVVSVPVTFASLDRGDIDVFLGNWMPSQEAAIKPYLDKGTIDTVATNLEGTKYNLAVPTYTWDKGLHSYDDLAKFADDLDDKIYGIEPGNEANDYLIGLTKKDAYGLGKFKIVESSEQGMLSQVKRFYGQKKDVVFLGWEPHPMNATFDLKYLKGGEDFFGSEGHVNTVSRHGFVAECPNAGKFFEQLTFTLPMENSVMGEILDEGMDPDKATMAWMKANPDAVLAWVKGVSTVDGGDGTAAVKKMLGL